MTRIVELQRGVLAKNHLLALRLRQRFAHAGTVAVNLVSSPGTGTTALLELLLRELVEQGHRVAALVGDRATDHDVVRLAHSGAPVCQIVTEGMCHLDADMVAAHLDRFPDPDTLEVLFVEHMGNLVCPKGFDLGESVRIALLSVTEGEDTPQRNPQLFHSADLAVITKVDLADAVGFDRAAAHGALHDVAPTVPVIETSARTGEGVAALAHLLLARRSALLHPAHGAPTSWSRAACPSSPSRAAPPTPTGSRRS